MEQMLTIIKSVAVLGLFMAAGFISVRTGYIKKETALSVSGVITRLMFPAWVMAKILSEEITKERLLAQMPMFLTGAAITLLLLGVGFLMSFIFKADDKQKYVLLPLFSAPNAIFLGLPICQGLFGDDGALSCTILALGSDIVSWTLTISLMAAGSRKIRGGKKDGEKSGIHINPVTVVFIISFILKMLGFNLPAMIQKPVFKFGSALSYMAMIYLGMMLVGVRIKNIFRQKLTYVHIPVKCLVIPIALGTLCALSGLISFTQVGVVAIVFAASPMISMTMFYKEYGLDYELGSSLTFACVVLNIITVPAAFWAVSQISALLGVV